MPLNRRTRSRSGAMLVQFGLVLAVLLAFVAWAIDLSLFFLQLSELEAAASSAATGAALDLPSDAVATAVRLVDANLPPGVHGTVLVSSDVQVGRWVEASRTFTPNATPVNAVRVTARKSDTNGNAAGWLVGSMFGLMPLDLAASSTAVVLPEFAGAIVSAGSINMTGSTTTDGYDSSQGPYDPATAGDGDIVTNGDISVGGSSVINGDAHGDTVSTGGNATITGTTSPARRSLTLSPVDTTEIAVDNDNDMLPLIQKGNNLVSPLDAQRNFSLSGGVNYAIPPGDYYFNDLKLSGQSILRISGPTTIYLTGNLDTSGGDMINSTQDPNNLRIFMTGGTAHLSASVDWYGLLYAPNTDVTISGSADIYGVIVGQNVTAKGTGDIHFDSGLTAGGGDSQLIAKRSTLVD